jgi:hypothetical protein
MAEDHLFVAIEVGVSEDGHLGYLVLVGLVPCRGQGLLVWYRGHRYSGDRGREKLAVSRYSCASNFAAIALGRRLEQPHALHLVALGQLLAEQLLLLAGPSENGSG